MSSRSRNQLDIFINEMNKAPTTSNQKLAFKWDIIENRFKTDRYGSIESQNRLESQTFEEMNKEFQLSRYSNPKSSKLNILHFLPILLLIPCSLLFPVLFIAASGEEVSKIFILFMIFGGVFSLLFILLVFALGFIYLGHFLVIRRLYKREQDFKKILEKYNERYEDRLVSFDVGRYGSYLVVNLVDAGARGTVAELGSEVVSILPHKRKISL